MKELTGGATQVQAVDQKTAYRELAKMVADPEVATAFQVARTAGRKSLTERQARLVARHDELLAANNAQAESERPKLPQSAPGTRPFQPRLWTFLRTNNEGRKRPPGRQTPSG